MIKDFVEGLLKSLVRLEGKKFFRGVRIGLDHFLFLALRNRVSKLPFPPRHVTILTTGLCSNRCTFCCHHSDSSKNSFSKHLYRPSYMLKFSEFKDIVDKCYAARVPSIHICAMGEPTIHPDFLKMLDYICSVYGKVSFQTNFNKSIYQSKKLLPEIIKRKDKIKYITTDIISYDKKLHNRVKMGSDYDYLIKMMSKISAKAPHIKFHLHLILTKQTYKNIDKLIDLLDKNKINYVLEVVNLHPYNYNDFCSFDKVYKKSDIHITKILKDLKARYGSRICVPKPFDEKGGKCGVFWSRLQVNFVFNDMPESQRIGNSLPGDCNAVVRGKMRTLGNIYKAKDLWEMWNGPILVKIRKNLINNVYPDKECKYCQNYSGDRSEKKNN